MKRQFILAWNNLLLRWAWKPEVRQVEQIPRFFYAHRATYQRGNAAARCNGHTVGERYLLRPYAYPQDFPQGKH